MQEVVFISTGHCCVVVTSSVSGVRGPVSAIVLSNAASCNAVTTQRHTVEQTWRDVTWRDVQNTSGPRNGQISVTSLSPSTTPSGYCLITGHWQVFSSFVHDFSKLHNRFHTGSNIVRDTKYPDRVFAVFLVHPRELRGSNMELTTIAPPKSFSHHHTCTHARARARARARTHTRGHPLTRNSLCIS